ASDYVATVVDSGAADDGVDVLTIEGTALDDTFLLRKNFISLLHGNAEDGYADTFERINYDSSINGRVIVNGNDGNDSFFLDDNDAILTLDGGKGDDNFQVGQIFSSKRDADAIKAVEDRFETITTTLGHLS